AKGPLLPPWYLKGARRCHLLAPLCSPLKIRLDRPAAALPLPTSPQFRPRFRLPVSGEAGFPAASLSDWVKRERSKLSLRSNENCEERWRPDGRALVAMGMAGSCGASLCCLLLGATGVGKTLLVKRLQKLSSKDGAKDLGDPPATLPTVGTNLTDLPIGKKITIRELGGCMGPIWSSYYSNCHAVLVSVH
uniref:ADP-ribosylation factor-like protein 16 n=1 Tax=Laticauda laticaudata TaxID=8630 RepID=A0A8C5SIA3_LATLA